MATKERQEIIDDLTVVCNSLGKLDENDGVYMKDRDCKACLREIIRYLNHDPKPYTARTILGELNIIKSDLIPLLVQYCDYNDGDPDLFTTILRLCTNLTSSVLLLFENEIPTEPEAQQVYNKLLKCLYGYKEAFASDDKVWSTLNLHMRHNLEDELLFERLVILIRNILHIPVDSTGDLGLHSDFDVHDMCLYRLDKSGMLNTIIKIAAETEKGAEYCFHLTEIIYLMLRDQNPETLATARPYALKRKLDDTDADKKRYAELSARAKREREMKNKSEKVAQIRFRTAAFVVQNYRSLSDEPLMVNHPTDRREKIDLNKGKTEVRKAKNRKALSSETSMGISDRNTKVSRVSFSLRNFCKLFVEKVYNNYMQQIKHNLIQKKTEENDESYYLWAIQFFTKFTRHTNLDISNISETLSTSTLHYIQILISSYQDKLKIEKKKFNDISKRLHLAIRAYREILYLIASIDSNSDFYATIESIQRNIFTQTEYSTLILTLLQQYEEKKHSLHYLEDLILTNDIFSQIIQEYSETHGAVDIHEDGEALSDDKPAKKRRKSKKKDFRSTFFMSRYCCPDVINAYMMKLKDFRNNTDALNLAILQFLERIVYDCKHDIILFQASVFKCLIDIMSYHTSLPGHERFVELGKHLMAKFGRMANKRRWMFQELLFWKTANDCVDIENAIDPPPAIPIVADDEQLNYDGMVPEQSLDADEEMNADTIAKLKAELADSSDSDWDEAANPTFPEMTESQRQPKNTVDDLLAELGDDPADSDGDLPELDADPAELESTPSPLPSPPPSLPPSPIPSESSE